MSGCSLVASPAVHQLFTASAPVVDRFSQLRSFFRAIMTLPGHAAGKWRFLFALSVCLLSFSPGRLLHFSDASTPHRAASDCRAVAALLFSHLFFRSPGRLVGGASSEGPTAVLSFFVQAGLQPLQSDAATSVSAPGSWKTQTGKGAADEDVGSAEEAERGGSQQNDSIFSERTRSRAYSGHALRLALDRPFAERHQTLLQSVTSAAPRPHTQDGVNTLHAPVSGVSSLPPTFPASFFESPSRDEFQSSGGSNGSKTSSPCRFSDVASPFSFVMEQGQQDEGAPRACSYARCASGHFSPRPANDIQQCFAFSTCSRCPRHAESHGDLCNQVEERKGMLLLLRSTIASMPSPVDVFHYKPLTAQELQALKKSKALPSVPEAGGGERATRT